MAQLLILDNFEGPGERKTAERLAAELPPSWVVIANRKLPGAERDDVDLLVLGAHRLFVVEEKAWGPLVVVGDNAWFVGSQHQQRANPLNRVNQLARKLAGSLRDKVAGYREVAGRQVLAAVVLSHDNLNLLTDPHHDPSERIYPLAEAAAELLQLDQAEPAGIAPVRAAVLGYLRGMPARPQRPAMLGTYRIIGSVEVPGVEVAYDAEAVDGSSVILKCYRTADLETHGDPQVFLRRESRALNDLADSGRAWRVLPFFTAEDDSLFVVPVVPPRERRNLLTSWMRNDPGREEGRLPDEVARAVVRDACDALAEVHEYGLVHRALHPRRIWLGRGLRILFSDFHLAKMSGEQTVALWAPDHDISEDYRAPECAASVGVATTASDVFSLALSLSSWLLGMDASGLAASDLREQLSATFPWAVPLADATTATERDRPSAEQLATLLAPPRVVVDAVEPPPNLVIEVGSTVHGRYDVERRLGTGGFADSWLVYDEQLQVRRVLKVFRAALPDDARREYGAADRLRHDRCARVYDAQLDAVPPYLVSEYVEGTPLAELLPLPGAEGIRKIAVDSLEGLAHVHSRGLVHGDVTPSNIIVGPAGDATLIDFGLLGKGGDTPQGLNPRFCAPEVRRGSPLTSSSDLFGLAATLLHACLGRAAVEWTPTSGTRFIPLTEAERTQWGPDGAALLQSFYRALKEEPSERPESAEAFAAQVRAARALVAPPDAENFQINPTVHALRRLYRASAVGNAGNRGLEDDFARETYVPTLLDTQLVPGIVSGSVQVVLLTGNPGDGKTSFLAKLGLELKEAGAREVSADDAGWELELHGRTYRAVYDASESHEGLSSNELVQRALAPAFSDGASNTALIAVNDGRLKQFLVDHDEYEELQFEVDRQMRGEAASDPRVALVDLKRRSLASLDPDASLALRTLETFTDSTRWEQCGSCRAREVCSIRDNAMTLTGPARTRLHELILSSHLRRRRRATFRDLRSALAWVLTGDKGCEDIHRLVQNDQDPKLVEDALVEDLAFDVRSEDYLVREWVELDPARLPAPRVDELRRTENPVESELLARTTLARRAFFSSQQAEAESVRAYRHAGTFLELLAGRDLEEGKRRILLGLSRLVGAFGYTDRGLAISSSTVDGEWSVLRTLPEEQFTLHAGGSVSAYVEAVPDAISLRHERGRALVLTLDTAEILLRAGDGELINDEGSDAVLQEIDGFINQLSREPSNSALLVDSAGAVSEVKRDGATIKLESS